MVKAINWGDYKELLGEQKRYEFIFRRSWHPETRKEYGSLAYWARKDVEAFEDKEMLPRMNGDTFITYTNIQLQKEVNEKIKEVKLYLEAQRRALTPSENG